jgi:hypothetical protein
MSRRRWRMLPQAAAVMLVARIATTAGGWRSAAPAARAAVVISAIRPPVASGHLTVRGVLRDGAAVRAAGITWKPGRMQRGQRLLSFEVGYRWRACTPSGTCAPAADISATPFAASRYTAGHADVGRRLRVTVTATEVVETDPATFTFRVVSASRTATRAAAVRPYERGREPTSEFLDGTPERRTGSREEYFLLSPPHYNAADGVPAVRFRIDRRSWRELPATRLLYTGALGLGQHTVHVRTSNRAGASERSFSWRIVPLPRPLACTPVGARPCWYPPHNDRTGHPMRWDWQIGRVTPLERTGAHAVDIYDIDGFLTTAAEISTLHTSWRANTLRHPVAVCYLDLAWEDYRPDASPAPRGRFPAATLGNVYFGYPQERWLDFRQLHALEPMIDGRIRMCASKGFDAVELDDIDSFDPPSTTGFHLTPGDAQNFLAYVDNEAHRHGMAVLWKNSPYLSWWGRRYTDGAVVEECYVYHECFSSQVAGSRQYGFTCTDVHGPTPCGWDDFTTDRTPRQPSGKWVGEIEYGADHYVCNPGQPCPGPRRYSTYCRRVYAPASGFAAAKLDVNLDGRVFLPCPNGG